MQPPRRISTGRSEPIHAFSSSGCPINDWWLEDHLDCTTESSHMVYCNIYDILPRVNAAARCCHASWGVFHTGVQVHGREFSFGGYGLFDTKPRNVEGARFRAQVAIGRTELDAAEVKRVVTSLASQWPGNTYHPFRRNCNHFTEFLCRELTGLGAPTYINSFTGSFAVRAVFYGCLVPFDRCFQHLGGLLKPSCEKDEAFHEDFRSLETEVERLSWELEAVRHEAARKGLTERDQQAVMPALQKKVELLSNHILAVCQGSADCQQRLSVAEQRMGTLAAENKHLKKLVHKLAKAAKGDTTGAEDDGTPTREVPTEDASSSAAELPSSPLVAKRKERQAAQHASPQDAEDVSEVFHGGNGHPRSWQGQSPRSPPEQCVEPRTPSWGMRMGDRDQCSEAAAVASPSVDADGEKRVAIEELGSATIEKDIKLSLSPSHLGGPATPTSTRGKPSSPFWLRVATPQRAGARKTC